jgi:hypothetical protein
MRFYRYVDRHILEKNNVNTCDQELGMTGELAGETSSMKLVSERPVPALLPQWGAAELSGHVGLSALWLRTIPNLDSNFQARDLLPARQDHLDAVVWRELPRLLEDPSLVQKELDRRLQAVRTTDSLKRRETSLRRDQVRLAKPMESLLIAYQEALNTLEELRCRVPEFRKQRPAIEAKLRSLEMAGWRPNPASAPRGPLAELTTRLRAGAGREASESRASVGKRDPGGQGQHLGLPFDSDANFFPRP